MWDQVLSGYGDSSHRVVEPPAEDEVNAAVRRETSVAQRLMRLFQSLEWWRWGLLSVGFICLAAGVTLLVATGSSSEPCLAIARGAEATHQSPDLVVAETAPAAKPAPSTPTQPPLVIDVSGAVANPGLYELAAGQRAGDAVAAAGGFAAQAHKQYLLKLFNAAAPLKDGQKLYIPFAGEDLAESMVQASVASVVENDDRTGSMSGSAGRLVAINSATATELDTLPGIGAVRAEAIVAGRPYTTLDELTERGILSQSVFDELAGLISL